MTITRGHHFASLNHLPSASWAIFFIAGFYISNKSALPILLSLAGLLDYVAIIFYGVSSYCISPAYIWLLPAYSTLWMAGRWYSQQYRFELKSLLTLMATISIATAVTSLLSGGSFYFFSGRYIEPNLIEYTQRFIMYFPRSLTNISFYVSIAVLIHIYISLTVDTAQIERNRHS